MSPGGSHDWELRESELEDLATAGSLVCSACVTDTALWDAVAVSAESATCSFCGQAGECVTFDDLEPVVVGAVSQFYETFEESGAYHEYGQPSEVTEDIRELVGELLSDAVTSDVWWSLRSYVAGRDSTPYGFVSRNALWATLYDFHEGDWRNFMNEARTGDPDDAAGMMGQLKSEVWTLFAKISEVAFVQGMFKSVQPTLWRCRPGTLEEGYWAAQDIGTAPVGCANAGRLNMKGDSFFYGGTTKRGAIVESVKHCGPDAELWVGEFTASRKIYHLDLIEIPEEGSPFADDAADTRDALDFLRRFAETISQPNDTKDKQHYLPTQIFAAFLLAQPDGPEAIRFASSLDPRSDNWVVFADRDHCVDEHAPDSDELFLVLRPGSVEHMVASELLNEPA